VVYNTDSSSVVFFVDTLGATSHVRWDNEGS